MDDLVKQSISLAEQKTRSLNAVPWKPDEPFKQSWYTYASDKRLWQADDAGPSETQQTPVTFKHLALYSWNIDFMLPYPDSRMRAAVRHIAPLIQRQQDDTATVIYLQECVESDLALLAADTWIQKNFAITDTSTSNWQSGHYGTTTLIDKRVDIQDVFRVHFSKTRMQRDGLFVDVAIPRHSGEEYLRLCNTHLESLALEPPLRPAQIELCAKYMHADWADGVKGAAVAGDFNAIQDFDKHLHSDNGLNDAYLQQGGSDDDAEGGHTWGQQAATVQRERFGTSRMDKVFFCGPALKCVDFRRFGAGVEVEDETEREAIVKLGFERPWVTDHLGVKAVFEIA